MRFLIRLTAALIFLGASAVWLMSSDGLTTGSVLQGIGLAALIIIALLVTGLAWLAYKIYRTVKDAAAQSGSAMAARIRLVESDEPGANPDHCAAIRSHFEAVGFQHAGRFKVDALQGLMLEAFVKPDEEIAAAIYDHETFKVFYDITAIDAGGNVFTITTSPLASQENVPPGSHVIIALNLPVQEAVRRLRAERPEGNWQVIEKDGITAAIEEAYARSMDFQIQRGTISASYVRQIAALLQPSMKLDDDTVERAITQHETGLRALIHEACVANFLNQQTLSADHWERIRDQVIVIHDRMNTPEIKALIDGYPPEGQEAKLPQNPLPAQEMFLKYLEKYRLLAKFRPLGTVEAPVPARLFQAPE